LLALSATYRLSSPSTATAYGVQRVLALAEPPWLHDPPLELAWPKTRCGVVEPASYSTTSCWLRIATEPFPCESAATPHVSRPVPAWTKVVPLTGGLWPNGGANFSTWSPETKRLPDGSTAKATGPQKPVAVRRQPWLPVWKSGAPTTRSASAPSRN